MDTFRKHEQFEIEVLDLLNSVRILPQLIFGGGTMLRMCYGLDRYSTDLDFYLLKPQYKVGLLAKCVDTFSKKYTITDQANKKNTLLIELSSGQYPRKLKIEINKTQCINIWNQEIAWSPYNTTQVMVNSIDLMEIAQMKVNALIDRKEIRDAYDLEFLLRKNIKLPVDKHLCSKILKIINGFSDQTYKVKLGSILELEKRQYYVRNHFRLLEEFLEMNI